MSMKLAKSNNQTSKYSVNRYNWLGHKFVAQHQYKSLINLRRHVLVASSSTSTSSSRTRTTHESAAVGFEAPGTSSSLTNNNNNKQQGIGKKPSSKRTLTQGQQIVELTSSDSSSSYHLTYLHGLALIKTSTRLDEILFSLQRLDLERNSQHFLLLCQCLLYSGNFDSVIALCKQLINKQIDTLNLSENDDLQQTNESKDFKNIFAQIVVNPSIRNPKMWLIFGKSLEYQHQFQDALFAYKVANQLSLKDKNKVQNKTTTTSINNDERDTEKQLTVSATRSYAIMSNYHQPSLEFSKFLMSRLVDYRTAQVVLDLASCNFSKSSQIETLYALAQAAQILAPDQFNKPIAILTSLEAHFYSHQNPSAAYNRLARRSRLRLLQSLTSDELLDIVHDDSDVVDPRRNEPSLTLAESYLLLSKWSLQDSPVKQKTVKKHLTSDEKQLDRLIEATLEHEPTCWRSSALWNNLGLLFYARGKLVGSFNCLLKANQMDPCNWRINFNLAFISHQVGVMTRANLLALASRKYLAQKSSNSYSETLINILIRSTYEKLLR